MCSHKKEANDLVRVSHKEARQRMVKEMGLFNKVSVNTVSHRGENCSSEKILVSLAFYYSLEGHKDQKPDSTNMCHLEDFSVYTVLRHRVSQ